MTLNRLFYIAIIFVFFSCASPVEQKSINGSSSTSLLPDLNLENGIEVVTWNIENFPKLGQRTICLLYTSPSPRDKRQSRMPSSA